MFNKLKIQDVRNTISFSGNKALFDNDNTIPRLQEEGVTALCKILSKKQYAYLADEVGMGKTYQAIGVISMMLKENPKSKILIIAPNQNVQNNWEKEIKNFRKNNILNEKIKFSIKKIEDQDSFVNSFVESYDENILLCRLTTFSTIRDSILKYKNPEYKHQEVVTAKKLFDGLCWITEDTKNPVTNEKFDSSDSGKICGKFLRKYTQEFNLVIIDEAQNLRNENNATTFINYWLGLKRCNDSKSTSVNKELKSIKYISNENTKYLLLSATPAHRGIETLRNQLLYFNDEENLPKLEEFTHEYLSTFLIRRLRTYGDDNKYTVRKTIPEDVSKNLEQSTEDGLKQRLFLALVQSKLAKENLKNNKTFKIGFLETLESYKPTVIRHLNDENGKKDKEFENPDHMNDQEIGEAPDKKLLKKISESFSKTFGAENYPPHPKLNFMEDEIKKIISTNIPLQKKETKAPDKALIFVRRLATVGELEARIITMYENRIISYWGNEFGISNPKLNDIKDQFEKLYNDKTARVSIAKEQEDENTGDIEPEEESTSSELIQWMTSINYNKGNRYTSVIKFKKSLFRNRTNAYLFTENYFKALYKDEDLDSLVDGDFVKEVNEYIFNDNKRYYMEYSGKRRYNHSDLLPLCCYIALKRKGETEIAEFIKDFYKIGNPVSGSDRIYFKNNIIKTLSQDSLWNRMEVNHINIGIKNLDKEQLYKRETLKAVTEKYLKSSEAVLEFMYCYCNIKETDADLCDLVMKRLFSTKCSYGIRIKKLFENSDLVYKELFGDKFLVYESELNKELKFLDLQQWVMPAIGGNKGNESIIKKFITPFYPDVIVCTDVLKEGINLHLFCNRIYHYGLAWTPGDLEQRIGRIDRFFSKTHRERMLQKDLPEEEKTKIEVKYPYLGKSVDEHQLKQVLKFKISADPLLDSKNSDEKSILIDVDEKSVKELAELKPQKVDTSPYSGQEFWEE